MTMYFIPAGICILCTLLCVLLPIFVLFSCGLILLFHMLSVTSFTAKHKRCKYVCVYKERDNQQQPSHSYM